MSVLSHEAQAIVDAFGRHRDVSPEQFDRLRTLIEQSPSLVARINLAVERGELRSIEPRSGGSGYDYDHRRLSLSLAALDAPPGAAFDPMPAVHALGHELAHGERGEIEQRERERFGAQVEAIARSPGPAHDYTQPIVDYVDASRRSEAHAEIAAFNTVVATLRERHGRPGLDDIYEALPGRMQNFIDKSPSGPPHVYTMKPGFVLGADNSMAATPGNVEAAAIQYYDRGQPAPYGLGQSKDGDYRHYYAAAAIGYAAQRDIAHRPPGDDGTPPRFTVALAEIGVDEAGLERNGIALGGVARLGYDDSSTDPPKPGWLDQTAVHAQASLSAPPLPPAPAAALRLDHPDHPPYARIRAGVAQVDADHGRSYDDFSERLTLTALARLKQDGGGVDHVALSADRSTLFLVQGGLDDPAHRRTAVPVADALSASLAQTQHRAETAVPAAPAHEGLHAQEPGRAQEPAAEAARGPSR